MGRGRHIAASTVVPMLLAASYCGPPRASVCPSGRVCRSGTICDPSGADRCIPDTCGNNIVEPGEDCDGGIAELPFCVDHGFDMGRLSCSGCRVDLSSCVAFNWKPLTPILGDDHHLARVWVAGPRELFAVGYTGRRPQSFVDYLFSGGGAVFHLEDTRHSPTARWRITDLHSGGLFDVWGSSRNNVFVVGDSGAAYRFDGTSWSDISIAGFPHHALIGVWGSGPRNVYATALFFKDCPAPCESLFHFDGNRWRPIPVDSYKHLMDVWGTGQDDIFAVGNELLVVHYNGEVWRQLPTPPEFGANPVLNGVWVAHRQADVFMVGGLGVILRYHRASETYQLMQHARGPIDFSSIWGTSEQNLFAASLDGTILHYDGNADNHWRDVSWPRARILGGVAGSAEDNVVVVGAQGTVLLHTGSELREMTTSANVAPISGIWGSVGDRVFAVGAGELAMTHDWSPDGRWDAIPMAGSNPEPPAALNDIHGTGPAAAFAVGGTQLFRYRDGALHSVYRDSGSRLFWDVWGHPGGDLFVVGDGGLILHRDVAQWREIAHTHSESLHAISGLTPDNLYIVGWEGGIYHFDGQRLDSLHQVPGLRQLRSVSATRDGALFAAGDWALVRCARLDIVAQSGCAAPGWQSAALGNGRFESIWAVGRQEAYAVGKEPGAFYFDGEGWSPISLAASGGFEPRTVWASSDGSVVLLGGTDGRVLSLVRR